MSEARHTPGPWVRHDTADYAEIHPASGKTRSAVALVGRAEDADLIAAAPDMLEALKAIRAHRPDYADTIWQQVEDAILKAEART